MILPPPMSALFPYTTLFRSAIGTSAEDCLDTNGGRQIRIGYKDLMWAWSGWADFHHPYLRLTFRRINRSNYRDNGLLRRQDRKSTRLNSSHLGISYAVFCLK